MSSQTLAGTVIDEKFRLDEQIGEGSMGAVYRGTQLMVDRPVAVKLLHPKFGGHDKIQARFEVEARAIARLNHPHCITLYDFGYSDDMEAFYTVVEYIDGVSLEHLVDRRPSIERVVTLVKQAASALGHAHHHGILHRDLKPENIMLAEMTDGTEMAKVLDFGIAQIMQGHDDEQEEADDFESDRLTRVGEVFGTPPYMSPEQSESTHDVTPATDLYSLGVIFYELIEGRLPFMANSPAKIMMMHREQQPPPLERPGIPESVESIIFQMLDKDPEARPESGDEIAEMLDAIPDEELEETFEAADTKPSDKTEVEPTLLTDPAEPETPDQSGPTLMSTPPESDAVAEATRVDDGSTAQASRPVADSSAPPADQPATGPAPDSAGGPPHGGPEDRPDPSSAGTTETADRPVITADQTRKSSQEVKATRMVAEDEDVVIDSAIEAVAGHRRKMIAGLVVALLIIGGGLAWVFVEYEPFSMADDEEMTEVGEVAAVTAGEQADEETDDSQTPSGQAADPGEDDPARADDEARQEAPREVAVSDESDDEQPEDEDEDDEDEEPDEEPEDTEEPAPAAEPTPSPQPDPTPREPAADEDDERDAPPRLEGPGDGDDDRPPRLDL